MKLLAAALLLFVSFPSFSHVKHLWRGSGTAEELGASYGVVQGAPCWSTIRIEGEDVYATVEQGTVRGAVATSELGTRYASFRGVPYARPPVGELRFQPPQPATPWEGPLDALEQPLACPQVRGRATSEDCLYLNVFAPLGATSAPVLVWIPGGGFNGGSSEHEGPDYFIQEGVVLAALNYRVGSLGFLSTEDEVVPGNMGLKDQLMALQWIQRNIAAFGGDPSAVTIGGESAGGGSVGVHLINPGAQGLFRHATIISGEASCTWGIVKEPRKRAFRLGELLGLSTNDSKELVDFLRTRDSIDLVSHDTEVIPEEERIKILDMPWSPVIEPDVEGAVVRDFPINNLKAGRFTKVPVLEGFTSGEGMLIAQSKGYLSSSAAVQQLNDNFVAATAPLIHLPTEEQREKAALQVRAFYFGNGNISIGDAQPIVDMLTDFGFIEPSDTAVRIIASHSDAAPIFYHLFDYRGPSLGNTTYGTPHGSQRSVLFPGHVKNPDEEFLQLRANMVRLWANFVKYGTPSPEGESIVWTPFNNADQNYMDITNVLQMKQNVYKTRMDFWHQNIPA